MDRINAASRLQGDSYSVLMSRLKKSNISLNRKMLAQIAVVDSNSFNFLSDLSK